MSRVTLYKAAVAACVVGIAFTLAGMLGLGTGTAATIAAPCFSTAFFLMALGAIDSEKEHLARDRDLPPGGTS